jgi:ribulose-bisphosphate carboxylase large chain
MRSANSPVADRFTVSYWITPRDGRSIEEHARDITFEQTVEVPPEVLPADHYALEIPGRIESIEAVPGQPRRFAVAISYRCDITAFSVPQFFNVLYGNISLKDNIRITALDLSDSLLAAFGGPRFGGAGLREQVGVYQRPLACTALKPLGLPTLELARLAGNFAAGGVDLIKDDHGLTDQHFHPFAERVARCQEAVSKVNAATGRNTLYFPMIAGGYQQLEQQVRIAVREGVRGILVGPMLVGFDALRHLAAEYGLIIMAHPALTGTFFHDRSHGMTPAVLLGSLFRLLGADVSVFPHTGGRFHFTPEECAGITTALREPLGTIKPALPCPAGGMSIARIPELAETFGSEAVLLIGGDLLRQDNVEAGTRQFMEAIRGQFGEQRQAPRPAFVSSCDWQPAAERLRPRDLLPSEDFRWQGRETQAYKPAGSADFKGVLRQELVGQFGEETAFDLRYFEIAPGGYSSLEKHLHEHVVIGVRGVGSLLKGGREYPLRINDIAYVRPLEVHQLHNRGEEPFGFYCIVDHKRDRPRKP